MVESQTMGERHGLTPETDDLPPFSGICFIAAAVCVGGGVFVLGIVEMSVFHGSMVEVDVDAKAATACDSALACARVHTG